MNEHYLKKAEGNTPELFESELSSDLAVEILPDEGAFWGVTAKNVGKIPDCLKQGDAFLLDFGRHAVGYLSFSMRHCDKYLDAPVRLRLRFGETPYEMSRDFSSYQGGLSPAWLQEEILNIDFPGTLSLPRRYSFRYLEITVLLANSPLRLADFAVRCVTSADRSMLEPLQASTDPVLAEIDRVAADTLADCMQSAYEDGPKRDRRLWSGDLRLQALTDYYLFKNARLARRCLYLFAACEEEGKYLPSCLYQYPQVAYDKGMGITDYAMLWCVSLCDYCEHTKDLETVRDLYPVAVRQIELAISLIDRDGVLHFLDGWSAFIDWAPRLRHLIPTEGVVLYAIERMIELARTLGDGAHADAWMQALDDTREGAYRRFFRPEENAFLEIDRSDYSVQAQVWMILGGVIGGAQARSVLTDCLAASDAIRPVTPYMHHYVVEAMLRLEMRDEARAYIKSYWGRMLEAGADTFWEAFDPCDPMLSPYRDPLMNSYCHAWSCSPSYFIRRFGL